MSGLNKGVAWTAILMSVMHASSQGATILASGVEVATLLPLIVKGFKEAAAWRTTLWRGFELASTTTAVV
jgi:hypothetical protein